MSPPFGLRRPLFQAPTGSIAGPELAAAVARAGGMGAMGLTWTEPEAAAALVRRALASAAGGLFQVNFALAFPPRALAAVLTAGAPAVTFSWGDPTPYVDRVRAAGARLGIQVTSAAGAHRARALEPDFLVCQGIEAGGHVQASAPLWQTLPAVLEAAGPLPVVASGGIATGEEIARCLARGAAGAMLGTRFVATQESRAHEEYKQALVRADAEATALTLCFDIGWPQALHRVLRNSTLERYEAAGSPPGGERPGEGETIAFADGGAPIRRYEDTAPRAGMTGRIEAMCLYAGAGVGAIEDLPTAGEVLERLWRQACRILEAS